MLLLSFIPSDFIHNHNHKVIKHSMIALQSFFLTNSGSYQASTEDSASSLVEFLYPGNDMKVVILRIIVIS